MEIAIQQTSNPKIPPVDETALGFGQVFTDHMFSMMWNEQHGWHQAQIMPFGDLLLSPAATCLHYGQEVFEGLKAYRDVDGNIKLFRPEENFKRMNASAKRLCIPSFDEDWMLKALKKLVRLDHQWVPHQPGTTLYIRPFIIGTERSLGANPANEYRLLMIMSPSGYYYPEGLSPVKIHVETHYIRAAAQGGLGEAKTGGNYAASFEAQERANQAGYTQVLWLDGVHRKYIEEVGSMNVFFVINHRVVTPVLGGSILPGITRKSVIELLMAWGYQVEERLITIDEVVQAYENHELQEAFGTGTAAIISPIGELRYQGKVMKLDQEKTGGVGEISEKLFNGLTGIQFGTQKDSFGWMIPIEINLSNE